MALSQKDCKLTYWLKVYDSNCVLLWPAHLPPLEFYSKWRKPTEDVHGKDCFPVGTVSFLGALRQSATWHANGQAALAMSRAVASFYFYFLWY